MPGAAGSMADDLTGTSIRRVIRYEHCSRVMWVYESVKKKSVKKNPSMIEYK